jgi:hypothetical protein
VHQARPSADARYFGPYLGGLKVFARRNAELAARLG